jgi:Tfp pilus assembly PilM family ATPase
MFIKKFFKLFPPPKFLNIPYAGLDISDDAIRCIEYHEGIHGLTIRKYSVKQLEPGVVESGYIKNESALIKVVQEIVHECHITNVKVSLPEERMYLFKTDVPTRDPDEMRQNIEFKLEENVPLQPADALFFFDILPESISGGKNLVSVSVAPREVVDSYLKVLETAGLNIFAFEVQPKAIARAVVSRDNKDTLMLVHTMDKKAGIYIVCAGVVCFTSTISIDQGSDISLLQHEISRVTQYWHEHGQGGVINKIILTGKRAVDFSKEPNLSQDPTLVVEVAQIWKNAFSNNHYVPPINFENSLEYAIAAGLGLP